MNCKDMMQIPELTEVLKLKAGKNGLEQSVRWIYFADCLQCVKSEYKIENYICRIISISFRLSSVTLGLVRTTNSSPWM